eukprot:4879538-Pleurochrysis_carterae.AAC.1
MRHTKVVLPHEGHRQHETSLVLIARVDFALITSSSRITERVIRSIIYCFQYIPRIAQRASIQFCGRIELVEVDSYFQLDMYSNPGR